MWWCLAVLAAPPHIVFVLQDDLGLYDVGWNNPHNVDVSGNITQLAREGIILDSHYVFYWCSPTRRSLLSGRLPVHHGEMLSGISDDLDLRWSLLSQKLAPAGYRSVWIGKGHTGFESWGHMPLQRGFVGFEGFLSGMQDYYSADRWLQNAPFPNPNLTRAEAYSTTLYGERALAAVRAHPAESPLFLYLPWQAVHHPHEAPPDWPHNASDADIYRGMLWGADRYIGALVQLLTARNMFERTLLVYSADNGGTAGGSNYPLRGYKRTNWEGGMRVAAFVSGGMVPAALRGTRSSVRMHIVDWYPTICNLAGVDPTDDPPVPPLPVDPADPSKDIYGNSSWPSIDGKDAWPALMKPAAVNLTSLHPTLVLSREVILSGRYKLLVAERGNTHQGYFSYENGWITAQPPNAANPDGIWIEPGQNGTAPQRCGLVQSGGCRGSHCDYGPENYQNTVGPALAPPPCGRVADSAPHRRSGHACLTSSPASLSRAAGSRGR